MSKSEHGTGKTPASGAGDASITEGMWGLVLWSGAAWFSDWFYQRLQWPAGLKRKRLEDLRASLPEGAWETLLLAIRNHLECGLPLDAELKVQLPGGRMEWWRMQGSVERNVGRQPVQLVGRMLDITAQKAPATARRKPNSP